jgi:hypothetical protein
MRDRESGGGPLVPAEDRLAIFALRCQQSGAPALGGNNSPALRHSTIDGVALNNRWRGLFGKLDRRGSRARPAKTLSTSSPVSTQNRLLHGRDERSLLVRRGFHTCTRQYAAGRHVSERRFGPTPSTGA